MTPESWLLIAGAYLLGAVPFGWVLARAAGVDVRDEGSGNIGATNVARTAGRSLGILTLVLDALKGAVPPLVGAHLLGATTEVQVLSGAAAVIGHVFPVYLGFRGGKGVATATGVFLAIAPVSMLIAMAAFLLVYGIVRVVSAASLVATAVLVAATVGADGRTPIIVLASAVAVLVFVRHAGNIRRLVQGRENKL